MNFGSSKLLVCLENLGKGSDALKCEEMLRSIKLAYESFCGYLCVYTAILHDFISCTGLHPILYGSHHDRLQVPSLPYFSVPQGAMLLQYRALVEIPQFCVLMAN